MSSRISGSGSMIWRWRALGAGSQGTSARVEIAMTSRGGTRRPRNPITRETRTVPLCTFGATLRSTSLPTGTAGTPSSSCAMAPVLVSMPPIQILIPALVPIPTLTDLILTLIPMPMISIPILIPMMKLVVLLLILIPALIPIPMPALIDLWLSRKARTGRMLRLIVSRRMAPI